MPDISIYEINVIETLILKEGYIRTDGKRFWFLGKGYIITKDTQRHQSYATVPGKMIKSLYRDHGLLTSRSVWDANYGHTYYYIHWEVYMPKIFDYECFKELQAQYAVGAVK